MRLLLDQDGVLFHWGGGWNLALEKYGDEARNIPRHEQQTTFNLNEGRTAREKQIIAEVMSSLDYYALDPIPGAKQALEEMLDDGHDVRIVTSPWLLNRKCASDKLNSIADAFGEQWATRTILTSDKTLIRGDILIDDKPEITGAAVPEWEHVLFDQPYNRNIDRPRITDWSNWSDAVASALLVSW